MKRINKYGPLDFVSFRWNATFHFGLRITKWHGKDRILTIRFAKSQWDIILWKIKEN